MAQTADRRVTFAYSEEWLDSGFAISPFSLPVKPKVFVPTAEAFGGLWGVFADSLPDAWGRLLVDRMLKSRGLSAHDAGHFLLPKAGVENVVMAAGYRDVR